MTLSNTPGALEGLVVLDASDTVAGQYCASLFAEYGASATLIEPLGGSPVRQMPPFHAEFSDQSLLFANLNLSKGSVTLDIGSPEGRTRLIELAQGADILIAGPHLNTAEIRASAPRCVIVSVSDFGDDGPFAGWSGSEIVHQALAGVMFENGKTGRAPLYGCGHRSYYAAGSAAFTAATAALLRRNVTGDAVPVSVEVAMTAASMSYCRTTQWEYSKMFDRRGSNKQPKAIVRAMDRWVCVFPSQHWWKSTLRELGLDHLADDPTLDLVTERQRRWREIIDEFQIAVQDRMADDVVASVQAVGGVVGREFTPYEVVRSDQLAARSFWETVETPDGAIGVLGPAFRLSATPRQLRGGPPSIGADADAGPTSRATGERLRVETSGPASFLQTSRGRLRVLDLSTEWAGPMAARILATLGADVIHVEAPQRMDGWRGPVSGGHESLYPGREPGARPYNRSAMFNTQNQGKRSLVIDLKTAGGRAAALAVAAECDIVLTNFRPGILERLGLGYDALRQLRDDIIVVQMPAFGSSGPMSTYGAVGPTMELAAGMASLVGYGDGEPIVTGPAYMDPIGAYNGASACMTALVARELGRGGQSVEMAQSEAGMHWVGEHLLAAATGGEVSVPHGNHVPFAAPHDAFRSQGDDEWIVIAATTEAEWRALCAEMNRPELATDPRFSTLALRLKHEVELHAEIVNWTHRWEKTALASRLQAVGVPAAPVLNGAEVAESEYLIKRGFFAMLDHPEAGRHRYQGLPIRIDGVTAVATRSAPCFGEHSREILTQIGHLSDAEVNSLLDAGAIIADVP